MRMDSKGDMGFGEAIIATIAVVLVFNILMVTAVLDRTSDDIDPGMDPEVLRGKVVEGVFVPEFLDQLEASIDDHIFSGVLVHVAFPGTVYDCTSFELGHRTENPCVSRHLSTVDDDRGYHVPVMYEVTIWV